MNDIKINENKDKSYNKTNIENNIRTIKLNRPHLEIHYDKNNIVRNKGNIYDCRACVRPGNLTKIPKVYVDKSNVDAMNNTNSLNSKFIYHNYGHSSIGWSSLFGSVNKAMDLFKLNNNSNSNNLENNKQNNSYPNPYSVPKDEKIVIIGAGCVGLYTALSLLNYGYTNIEIIAEKVDNLASYNSGALYYTGLENVTTNLKNYAEEIFLESYNICKQIIEGKHFINEGISEIDGYYGDEDKHGAVFCQ